MKTITLLTIFILSVFQLSSQNTDNKDEQIYKYSAGVNLVHYNSYIYYHWERTKQTYFNINASRKWQHHKLQLGLIMARKLHFTYQQVNEEIPWDKIEKEGFPIRGVSLGYTYTPFNDPVFFLEFESNIYQYDYTVDMYNKGQNVGGINYGNGTEKIVVRFYEETTPIMANYLGVGLKNNFSKRLEFNTSFMVGYIYYFSDEKKHVDPFHENLGYMFKIGIEYNFNK